MYKYLVVAAFFACSFSAYSQKTYNAKTYDLQNLGLEIGAFKEKKFIQIKLNGQTFFDRSIYIPQSKNAYINPFGTYWGIIYLSPELKIGHKLSDKWHNVSRLRLDIAKDVTKYLLGTQFVHSGKFILGTCLPINLGVDVYNTKVTNVTQGTAKRINTLQFQIGVGVAKRFSVTNQFVLRPSIQTNLQAFLELVPEDERNNQYRVMDASFSSVQLAALYKQFILELAFGKQSTFYGDKIGNHFNYSNLFYNGSLKYYMFQEINHLPKFIF